MHSMQIHSEYTDDPEEPTAGEPAGRAWGSRKQAPSSHCMYPACWGDCSGQSWEAWGFKSANPHVQGPHAENGKNEVQPASPNLRPVPDSGQSSGIYPGPSLMHEAPTNLLSATSRQAPSEVLAWSPVCPEQMPGLMSGQERRSWSCPSPSISLLPGSSRAADPKCPSSVSRGHLPQGCGHCRADYETWARCHSRPRPGC